jgi:hypothetical protein
VTTADLIQGFYRGVAMLAYVTLRAYLFLAIKTLLLKALAGLVSVGIVSKFTIYFRRWREKSKT